MHDLRLPLPGDVLFFTSSKPHGILIKETQKIIMKLQHHDFMHAALVVDSDMIVESTTLHGVHKIRLSELQDPKGYLNATVLRKSSIEPFVSLDERENIMKFAFYFYKQAYDWRGIILRDANSRGRKLCSAFVKECLVEGKIEKNVIFSRYRKNLYPAELYDALIGAGYSKLTNGYDPIRWARLHHSAIDVFDIMESSRSVSQSAENVTRRLQEFRKKLSFSVQELLYSEPVDLIKVSMICERLGISFLHIIHETFGGLLETFAQLNEHLARRPENWRDVSKDVLFGDADLRLCTCDEDC
jgi:hypothetical protein